MLVRVDDRDCVRRCCRPIRRALGIAVAIYASCLAASSLLASSEAGPAFQLPTASASSLDRPTGRLTLLYSTVKDPECSRIHDLLRDSGVLEKIVGGFNDSFALPIDLTIAFKECGEPNAYYDHDKKRVTFCYELIGRLDDAFSEERQSDDELEDATVGATAFMVYHELAHALLRLLNPPPLGKTEDSVDQLSTYLLVRGVDEGEAAALDGAIAFSDEDADSSPGAEKLPFWGDHSLNSERFDRIVCWIYGHDDEAHADLVDDGILPEGRAVACRGEWAKISKTWAKRLDELGRK